MSISFTLCLPAAYSSLCHFEHFYALFTARILFSSQLTILGLYCITKKVFLASAKEKHLLMYMYVYTSISSAWFRVRCIRRRNLWFVIRFLFALFAYELLHPRHGTGKLPFNSHFNYPMPMPMPTQASSSPARWVAFENLGSYGLMSDNTLWARTVSVCESVCVCVRVCVCFVVRISFPFSFFFLGQLKVFRWQKLCGNLFCCVSKCPCGIYTFARVLTVCTSFSPA